MVRMPAHSAAKRSLALVLGVVVALSALGVPAACGCGRPVEVTGRTASSISVPAPVCPCCEGGCAASGGSCWRECARSAQPPRSPAPPAGSGPTDARDQRSPQALQTGDQPDHDASLLRAPPGPGGDAPASPHHLAYTVLRI